MSEQAGVTTNQERYERYGSPEYFKKRLSDLPGEIRSGVKELLEKPITLGRMMKGAAITSMFEAFGVVADKFVVGPTTKFSLFPGRLVDFLRTKDMLTTHAGETVWSAEDLATHVGTYRNIVDSYYHNAQNAPDPVCAQAVNTSK